MNIFAVSFNEAKHDWNIKPITVRVYGNLLQFNEDVGSRSCISVDNLGKITDSKVFCDEFGIEKAKETLLEGVEDKIDDLKDDLSYWENLKFDMEIALKIGDDTDASI